MVRTVSAIPLPPGSGHGQPDCHPGTGSLLPRLSPGRPDHRAGRLSGSAPGDEDPAGEADSGQRPMRNLPHLGSGASQCLLRKPQKGSSGLPPGRLHPLPQGYLPGSCLEKAIRVTAAAKLQIPAFGYTVLYCDQLSSRFSAEEKMYTFDPYYPPSAAAREPDGGI